MSNGLSKKGFSLLEVMIAMSIFAVFIVAYVGSEGLNKVDSTNMREELLLQELSLMTINQLILDPPAFEESLTLKPEVKKFEDEEYANYEYSIEYKRLKIPDLTASSDEDSEEETSDPSSTNTIVKTVSTKMKKFLEDKIWQVRVTVRNKETNFNYSLSTWLNNKEAQLDLTL